MLVGRFYGPGSVGLYTRAAALLRRPMEQFLSPISSVFVPVLSRIQTQPERYRRTFLQVYETMVLASFLGTGLLLALARPLTLVVLGPKWEQAIIIFSAFTFAALCSPPATTATWLFASQGRGKDWFQNHDGHRLAAPTPQRFVSRVLHAASHAFTMSSPPSP